MKQSEIRELGDCMINILFAVSQLHYVHWLTEKNHHHEIIGETYTELSEELDSLVEQYLGAMSGYKVSELLPEPTMPMRYSYISTEDKILGYLDQITKRLEKGMSIVKENTKLSFMVDTLSDMLVIVHSAKYQIRQE